MGLLNNLFGNGNSYTEKLPKYYDNDHDRQKRLERYKRTWEAYLAELPDPIVQDGPSNDNVKVNPARAIVNTGVFFLFGSELKFQVSPDAAERYGDGAADSSDTPNKVADPKWLKQLNKAWKANRKKSFLFNMGLSGSLHGDVFVKIVPDAAGMNNEFPRLLILDPANVDVETDPNDCNQVLEYTIQYVVEIEDGTGSKEPALRIQRIKAVQDETDRIIDWTIQDFEQPMGYVLNTGYVPMHGEERPVGPPVNWGYPWPPIEHCQNVELPHMFWGLPDLDESSVSVIESIQRSMSSLNKIVRVHASPRMFAKNVMPDQVDEIDVSPDNVITLPNMEADLQVLQTLGNLSPSIEYARQQRAMLLEMIQTPPISLGEFESASTAISGVTLSILYAPLLQKTELKRISYGDMIERLNFKLLTLMGFDPEEFESLILVWPEAMPGSAYLERQTLSQDQMLGASNHTILSRLGYDPKEERQHFLEEQEEMMEMQKKYAPEPAFGSSGSPGGNNNPQGKGNKNGSLGGTKAAGTPKTSSSSPKPSPSK
jgi:hypothetical protein